jgi:hypothetical protein
VPVTELPSLRYQPDDPRPVGFTEELTAEHIEASATALGELAAVFDADEGAGAPLRACLSSARYVPALPFELLSFHLVSFDESCEPIDALAGHFEVHYAFIVNQAVEVQREAALLFLYEIVFRQSVLQKSGGRVGEMDILTAVASERARAEFRDRMRGGWSEAARSLAARARHEGVRPNVRYQQDPFPDRELLARRMDALRHTYNTLAQCREFVDKTVSLIGGRDPRISVPGAADSVRVLLERRLTETGFRQYMNQTIRDAEVLGNGYLVLPSSIEQGPYALRPEDVEIQADGGYAVLEAGGRREIDGNVTHATGVEQFGSPYGFSVLEAFLPEWVSRRTMSQMREDVAGLLTQHGDLQGRRGELEGILELTRRQLQASDERIAKLLWYPREWLPDAAAGLYLPGQEQM